MMQDQILQTLLRKENHSDNHGHDGFWDGPGNPIQSNFFPRPFSCKARSFADAGVAV